MIRKLLLGCVCCILVMTTSGVAKTYTIEECIDLALQTDPTLESVRNQVKLASADVLQQVGEFLPSVGVSGSFGRVHQGPTSPQLVDLGGGEIGIRSSQPGRTVKSYSAGLSVDYTLFDGLQNIWNFLGSRASKSRSDYDYASQRSDLVFLTKGNYYLVLKAKRDIEVAEEAVKRSEEQLKLFQEKYDLGAASLSEVLKQRVQVGNDKLTLVNRQRDLEVARYVLAVNIGVDPQSDYDIEDLEFTKRSLDSLPDLVREAMATHPNLMAAQAEVSASKYDVRSAWGQYMPRVSLSYSYGWGKNRFDDIVKLGPYDHSERFSVSINYTIFNGFSRHRNMTRAKATLNNAEADYNYRKNNIIKELKDAYLGIKVADETLSVTAETEDAAKEDFDLVQAKYDLGSAALWELLDAQVSLKGAQFQHVKAEFDYNLAQAKLLNALGR